MDDRTKQILKNQAEIMHALRYLLQCAKPNLVGKGGELDRMCDDLMVAARETVKLL